MRKIIYFPDVIRSFINRILSVFPTIAIIVLCVYIILHIEKIKKIRMTYPLKRDGTRDLIRSAASKAYHLLLEIKRWLTGIGLVSFSWYIIIALFNIFHTGLSQDLSTQLGKFKQDIDVMQEAGITLLNTDVLYNKSFIGVLNYQLGLIGLWSLTLFILSGFFYTLSFDNKIRKSVGSILLIIGFLLILLGVAFQFWSFELEAGIIS